MNNNELIKYVTYLGDNNLILGHRLSEWCGHGPVLEQDIALSNIALDLIGQSRMYYQYAAELMGEGHTEDSVAYLRSEREYRNALLVEQPNGDYGRTIVRQFIYDSYHYYFLRELQKSTDKRLAEIAEKSIKEVAYHKRYSSEWLVRLGDGTSESHRRVQAGMDLLWRYANELTTPLSRESDLLASGVIPDPAAYLSDVDAFRNQMIQTATLAIPETPYFQFGGKEGLHTEYLGHLLAELQYVQRAYPGLEW